MKKTVINIIALMMSNASESWGGNFNCQCYSVVTGKPVGTVCVEGHGFEHMEEPYDTNIMEACGALAACSGTNSCYVDHAYCELGGC
ncbi:MAG: hypothetical protein JSR85_00070 [Proteobacteria bacterium]|nr:hypothetical protein [Pseudomonadota bacterium]